MFAAGRRRTFGKFDDVAGECFDPHPQKHCMCLSTPPFFPLLLPSRHLLRCSPYDGRFAVRCTPRGLHCSHSQYRGRSRNNDLDNLEQAPPPLHSTALIASSVSRNTALIATPRRVHRYPASSNNIGTLARQLPAVLPVSAPEASQHACHRDHDVVPSLQPQGSSLDGY